MTPDACAIRGIRLTLLASLVSIPAQTAVTAQARPLTAKNYGIVGVRRAHAGRQHKVLQDGDEDWVSSPSRHSHTCTFRPPRRAFVRGP